MRRINEDEWIIGQESFKSKLALFEVNEAEQKFLWRGLILVGLSCLTLYRRWGGDERRRE